MFTKKKLALVAATVFTIVLMLLQLQSRHMYRQLLKQQQLQTESRFDVWDVPTPNQPVISTHRDFQWVYPAIHDKIKFAQQRFVANEFKPCLSTKQLCCTIGSAGFGGGQVYNGCGFNMDFMVEFQPIPARPLFSLVEVLLAWRKAYPDQTKFQMVFIGDSVTGQMFTAALCELARNAKVKSLTFDTTSKVLSPLNATSWRHAILFQESHIQLAGENEHEAVVDYCLIFVRQYRLTPNVKAVELFLREADVIMVGWGLHYEKTRELFPPALDLVFTTLRALHQGKKRTVVWFGALQQHFRYDGNNNQVDGLHKHGKFPTKFCGPVARFPPDHTTQVKSINRFAFDYITNKLNVSASWFRWNNNHSRGDGDGLLHVHFLPYAELTAPFFRNHKQFNTNVLIEDLDCTHPCSAPNLDEPIWDALYVIIHGSATPMKRRARYPSGTQQFPPIAKWNETRFSAILHSLQGEIL